MKFKILCTLLSLATIVVMAKGIRRTAPPQTVQTPAATVKIFNNTASNAWVNVPIEITSLGGAGYRVTNKTSMVIRRFIIALYAAYVGKPFHGEDAARHFVQVRVTDKPIPPGKWVEINIEENLKEFGGKEHNHAADMSRIE